MSVLRSGWTHGGPFSVEWVKGQPAKGSTMKVSPISVTVLSLISLLLPACHAHNEEHHQRAQKIVATHPQSKNVTLTQQYVCQIHSRRHIKIRALEEGYLEAIPIKE